LRQGELIEEEMSCQKLSSIISQKFGKLWKLRDHLAEAHQIVESKSEVEETVYFEDIGE
jgi:hypothetical protein